MNNDFQTQSSVGAEAVNKTLSRLSCVTLSVSFLALAVFEIIQTFFSSLNAKRLNFLESVYYMLGDGSISIVNIVFGAAIFLILITITAGLFITHEGAVKNSGSHLRTGLNMTLYALSVSIVFEVICIVISLASISIINYNYYVSIKNNSTYESYESTSAINLFFLTVVFGAAAVTLTISLIRLILSFKRNIFNKEISKKGAILTVISSIFAAVIIGCVFCTTLFSLVFPQYDRSNPQAPDPAELTMNTLYLLITASLVVIFIVIPIVVFYFMSYIENKTINSVAVYNNVQTYNANSYLPQNSGYASYPNNQNFNSAQNYPQASYMYPTVQPMENTFPKTAYPQSEGNLGDNLQSTGQPLQKSNDENNVSIDK